MIIAVTGATGTVGRQVVDHLVMTGHQVRALTRRPEAADLPASVQVVAGDLEKVDTLEPLFTGADAAHLINFGHDYQPLANGREIADLLVAAGVGKATLLGGWDEGSVEPAVRASALAWTHLRPVEFMANVLEDWAEPVRTSGAIHEPFGDRLSAVVHESDIGAVAAAVLTSEGGPGRRHAGQTYTITGPEALTPRDKLRILGDAIGRELRFVELSVEEARKRWLAEGTPEHMVDFMLEAWGNTPQAGYTVTDVVEQVTGRPAQSFARWCEQNADTFR